MRDSSSIPTPGLSDPPTADTGVILAASEHNIPSLSSLLKHQSANQRYPQSLITPLHAAILFCGRSPYPFSGPRPDTAPNPFISRALETVHLLLLNGAIWNDLDAKDRTPGCVAEQLQQRELYDILVEAGVRAELLLWRLSTLGTSGSDSEDETEASAKQDENKAFLSAPLTLTPADPVLPAQQALQTAEAATVMHPWETPLMAAHAEALLPEPGLSLLNIGFGLGLFDAFAAARGPMVQHVMEAHPDVIKQMGASWGAVERWEEFTGKEWPAGRERHWLDREGVVVHSGRWQDVLPRLVEEGVEYDAVFFDTYAEGFEEFMGGFVGLVGGVLKKGGRWGFFNGGGGDRRVVYDVMRRVVEERLESQGWEVEWEMVRVDRESLGKGEEVGGAGRYWVLDEYWLPTVKLMGVGGG